MNEIMETHHITVSPHKMLWIMRYYVGDRYSRVDEQAAIELYLELAHGWTTSQRIMST